MCVICMSPHRGHEAPRLGRRDRLLRPLRADPQGARRRQGRRGAQTGAYYCVYYVYYDYYY